MYNSVRVQPFVFVVVCGILIFGRLSGSHDRGFENGGDATIVLVKLMIELNLKPETVLTCYSSSSEYVKYQALINSFLNIAWIDINTS